MEDSGGFDALKLAAILGVSITMANLHLYLSIGALILYIVWLIIKIFKEFN